MVKVSYRDITDALLHFIAAIGAFSFLILAPLGLFALVLIFIFIELPLGIKDEARLVNHFENNQDALELVVEEVFNTDLRRAQRASYSVFGGSPRRPDNRQYEPLFRAMRRAKVQEVWVNRGVQPNVTLVMGIKSDLLAPDRQYFGYSWSRDLENVMNGPDARKGQETQLAPNWSLYWLFEE